MKYHRLKIAKLFGTFMSIKQKCKFNEIRTLGWKNDATVKELLQRAAKMCQPILKKRGWSVNLLKEFYPKDRNLLGLNDKYCNNCTISIRCRKARDRNTLLPFNEIVGTLIHEITHIKIGPHNAAFKKLMNELFADLDDFQLKGIVGSGAGFDIKGSKLDGCRHNPISMVEARMIGVKSAENRAKKQSLLKSGKIGGKRLRMNAREAARQAALKRLKVNS